MHLIRKKHTLLYNYSMAVYLKPIIRSIEIKDLPVSANIINRNILNEISVRCCKKFDVFC